MTNNYSYFWNKYGMKEFIASKIKKRLIYRLISKELKKVEKILKDKPLAEKEMRKIYLETERDMIVHWFDELIADGMTPIEALKGISNFVFGKRCE